MSLKVRADHTGIHLELDGKELPLPTTTRVDLRMLEGGTRSEVQLTFNVDAVEFSGHEAQIEVAVPPLGRPQPRAGIDPGAAEKDYMAKFVELCTPPDPTGYAAAAFGGVPAANIAGLKARHVVFDEQGERLFVIESDEPKILKENDT
jgi:hypothetical protein